MKKLLSGVIFVLVFAVAVLSGCSMRGNHHDYGNQDINSRYVFVSRDDVTQGNLTITMVTCYDRETKVMYLLVRDNFAGSGTTITVLYDAEGKPLLYQGAE